MIHGALWGKGATELLRPALTAPASDCRRTEEIARVRSRESACLSDHYRVNKLGDTRIPDRLQQ